MRDELPVMDAPVFSPVQAGVMDFSAPSRGTPGFGYRKAAAPVRYPELVRMKSLLPKQPNQSIIDGIRCLQGVASYERPVGVFELALALDLEKTRVHRLLRTLAACGLISRLENRKYTVGPGLPVLAAQTMHAIGFGSRMFGPLEKLHHHFAKEHLLVALGLLWERSVSYLFHGSSDSPVEGGIATQHVWPASQTGVGVALLAELDDESVERLYLKHEIPGYPKGIKELLKTLRETRRRGYAVVKTVTSNTTVAMVVRSEGNMALALSGAIDHKKIPGYLVELQKTAELISARR